MKKTHFYCFLISFLIYPVIYGQDTPVEKGLRAITSDVIKAQVGFLSSDWTEGREAGEKGEYLAADYIASILRSYGVKPGGDYSKSTDHSNILIPNGRSYFQNFVILKTLPGDRQILELISKTGETIRTTAFTYNLDFIMQPSFSSVKLDAPVVFAGYGFINDKLKYNDFSRIDVKGKFILKISGLPEFAETMLAPSELNASVEASYNYARKMGAAGILEFDPTLSVVGKPEPKEFMNLSLAEHIQFRDRPVVWYSLPGKNVHDNFLRITVSLKVANEIMKGSGIDISDYLKKADSNKSAELPSLTGKTISFISESTTTQVAVRNVIGVIEGNNSDQIIVIGAHYDHLGARDGYIWNGADDNASGTVGVMTIAKAIIETDKKPEKTIIIALWTSEEIGLIGSRYYLENLTYPLKNLKLNLNMDMISRYISEDNKKGAVMTYTSSHPYFRDITEANLLKYSIDLILEYQPSDNPPGGSDHRSFVEAGIPILRFKPGHREEYHTPYDETETLDWDIMEKIIRIGFVDIWDLANSNLN
jgi:hypothetical protein